jgi:Iap family predicted aminopeptidase
VLALAEGWHKSPAADDVELVVLLSGCEESGMLGAAAWADRHRRELRTLPATFLNIDAIGFGPPRFLGAEVPIAGLPLRTARQIVDECSEAAADLGLSDAGPHAVPGPTDGLAFLARQIPGVTITGFRSGGVMPHYHTLADTAANMDFAAARTAVAFAQAVLTRLAMMG